MSRRAHSSENLAGGLSLVPDVLETTRVEISEGVTALYDASGGPEVAADRIAARTAGDAGRLCDHLNAAITHIEYEQRIARRPTSRRASQLQCNMAVRWFCVSAQLIRACLQCLVS